MFIAWIKIRQRNLINELFNKMRVSYRTIEENKLKNIIETKMTNFGVVNL